MKVGVIGAGVMGSGIAQAFAMTDGYEVYLCDIKQEFADGGKAKIEKNINFLVGKEKIQELDTLCPLILLYFSSKPDFLT